MPTVNKVMILGHMTRDPELRYVPSGAAVCEFSLALNRSHTNKQTGEKVDEVSFIDVVAWGRTAEVCAEYLKKGRPVFVEGRLTQDRWETEDGQKRSRIRVTAENIQFIGSKQDGDAGSEGGGEEAPAQGGAAAAGPAKPDDCPF